MTKYRGRAAIWKTPELLAAIQLRYDGTTATINALVAEFDVPRYIVNNYAKKLGVSREKESDWSDKDIQYLIDNWSNRGLEYCAKRLKRTVVSVNLKAKRLGLGGVVKGSQYLTGQNVANLLGIDIHCVLNWLQIGLLKFKNAPINRVTHLIEIADLEQFLKENLHIWDSRKMKGSLWIQDPE
ncbi:MAG: hypothetical protein K0Q73_8720, partial [Paenibacillus sp.]|nr:hypothetical protein [Paenibacillus sp.]